MRAERNKMKFTYGIEIYFSWQPTLPHKSFLYVFENKLEIVTSQAST